MNYTNNTNSTLLNKVYDNLIDYVSLIQQQSTGKENWTNRFIEQCEKGPKDFSFVYKNLKEGLITQFGFEMANEVILPEIMWSSDLAEFCE